MLVPTHRTSGQSSKRLMLVAALFAVIAALLVPNLMNFEKRAKQSEAKNNLMAIFTAKNVCYQIEKSYINCGFANVKLPKQKRYTYWSGQQNQAPLHANLPPNTNHCTALPKTSIKPIETRDTFLAVAVGQLDRDPECDVWTIDQNGLLKNQSNDSVDQK